MSGVKLLIHLLMRILYSSIRFVLLAILGFGFAQQGRAAQLQYATAVASDRNVVNPALAIDNSPLTAATLTAPALLGSAHLRLAFASSVPKGGMAGLIIQAGSNLDLSLLSGMSIRTYVGSSNSYEESIPLSSLVNLSLLGTNGGKVAVEFPAGKAFNQVGLYISGLLNASFDVDLFSAYATLPAPLPVELAMFQGKSTAAGVALAWSTASERSSDYFVVERADDSPENFRGIGKVQAAGTATQRTDYAFTDATPAATSYYRLRQVDLDGTTSFSPVVTVKKAAWSQPLSVYPNPATETVTLAAAPGTRFAVFNQLGRQLQTGEVAAGVRPALDVRRLPNGVYFVRDLSTGSSTRFVKADASE